MLDDSGIAFGVFVVFAGEGDSDVASMHASQTCKITEGNHNGLIIQDINYDQDVTCSCCLVLVLSG